MNDEKIHLTINPQKIMDVHKAHIMNEIYEDHAGNYHVSEDYIQTSLEFYHKYLVQKGYLDKNEFEATPLYYLHKTINDKKQWVK